MLISERKEIESALNRWFETYREERIDTGDYNLEPNYVAYGDTDVVEGYYLSDEDEDSIKESFIEELSEKDSGIAGEILDGYLGEDITEENIKELIKIAEEIL